MGTEKQETAESVARYLADLELKRAELVPLIEKTRQIAIELEGQRITGGDFSAADLKKQKTALFDLEFQLSALGRLVEAARAKGALLLREEERSYVDDLKKRQTELLKMRTVAVRERLAPAFESFVAERQRITGDGFNVNDSAYLQQLAGFPVQHEFFANLKMNVNAAKNVDGDSSISARLERVENELRKYMNGKLFPSFEKLVEEFQKKRRCPVEKKNRLDVLFSEVARDFGVGTHRRDELLSLMIINRLERIYRLLAKEKGDMGVSDGKPARD